MELPGKTYNYSDFWSDNIQKIEIIQNELQRSVLELEKKYTNFEPIYSKVESLINLLWNIYTDYNVISGIEYLRGLKKTIALYKRRYTREGIDFEQMNNLILSISTELNKSFQDFPEKIPDEFSFADVKSMDRPLIMPEYSGYAYKWVTFKRNGSWFITRFDDIKILNKKNFEIKSRTGPETAVVSTGKETMEAKDIFSDVVNNTEEPGYLVLLENSMKNYIATFIGRRIFSKKDIISPHIKPFKEIAKSVISPGRIRLFGSSHIFLK